MIPFAYVVSISYNVCKEKSSPKWQLLDILYGFILIIEIFERDYINEHGINEHGL